MELAVMQPYFLPYLGYFQLINEVDEFILFDDVNFIKKGYINRNSILLASKEHVFSLPVEKVSQNKLINETYLKQDDKAKENLIKTIKSAYSKAPYYKDIFPVVENIINNQERNISLYIKYSVDEILKYLSIKKKIEFSSELNFRRALKGQERIIEICRAKKADTYINAIGGVELYDKEVFENAGIDLKFIKMNEIKYKQFHNEFVQNLSIIDVLMFNSKEQIKLLLNEYTLIPPPHHLTHILSGKNGHKCHKILNFPSYSKREAA